MADYTKKTRQGYTVKKLYLNSGNISTILAVIDRGSSFDKDSRYMWAFAYHLEDGSWGQGHYDYPSQASAEKDLKSSYPRAKTVNPNNLMRVETDNDSFGKFDSILQAKKKLYQVAKTRRNGETVYLTQFPSSKVRMAAVWNYNECIVVHADWPGVYSVLGADGYERPMSIPKLKSR